MVLDVKTKLDVCFAYTRGINLTHAMQHISIWCAWRLSLELRGARWDLLRPMLRIIDSFTFPFSFVKRGASWKAFNIVNNPVTRFPRKQKKYLKNFKRVILNTAGEFKATCKTLPKSANCSYLNVLYKIAWFFRDTLSVVPVRLRTCMLHLSMITQYRSRFSVQPNLCLSKTSSQ